MKMYITVSSSVVYTKSTNAHDASRRAMRQCVYSGEVKFTTIHDAVTSSTEYS